MEDTATSGGGANDMDEPSVPRIGCFMTLKNPRRPHGPDFVNASLIDIGYDSLDISKRYRLVR